MQRETALALFGVGLVLLLLLVGVALYTSSPHPPQTDLQRESTPTVTPAAPPAFPPTQTVSPVSPPAIVTPSLPPPATQTVAPQITTPTVASFPGGSAVSSPAAAPLPPVPSQVPNLAALPPASPAPSAGVAPENEALRWAKALVSSYRPRWRLNLVRSVAPNLRGEGYAVTVEPNDRVTVEAGTDVGLLYGLLDLAEKLQWRDVLPAQWRWTPPLSERGLVVERPEWLTKPPRSLEAMRNTLRDRLKELAWWRFNTLVLKCSGREPALGAALGILRQISPDYGVKVVVWAQEFTPAVRAWVQSGGSVATESPSEQNGSLLVLSDFEQVARNLEQGKFVVFAFQLLAPNVPVTVSQLRRNREKLSVLVGLDRAYEGVFWFDPEWAHQLVRSARDVGLKGLWLSVRSVPSGWAVAAFAQAVKNPESDGESLWLRRWARQGFQAEKWVALFREASRIIPETLWLGVSPEPQYGALLKAFFTSQPVDRSWGFTVLSLTETVKLSRQPSDKATLTTEEVARRLEQRAQAVWALTAQLPEPSAPDWKLAKRLALLNSWLGQFYADKIDAASAWLRFESGDKGAGQDCLFHLAKSVKAWEQVVAIANSVYPPKNRWALRLAELQRELDEFKGAVAASMP